ncbi:DhaG protein [Sporanaerobium hydrogeniformans]|uniref:DhaG protein n=1 Tax=Sporanaerobium hydrogeniformans TaxID=3072179 RepID=A0AC61DHM3_9FIRM|nr:heme-binding protein [Sporanaerobium hydrogeniformans]PHV72116.1 DhaG protein [Sporanaerobium hydrogeniformans]
MELTLELANQLIERIKAYARYNNVNAVMAIVSKEGNPISVQVMEDAYIVSYELALKKAYTSAALKMPTHELAYLVKEGGDLEGLLSMLDGNKLITLGGGYPITLNGKVVGGLGVSGGTAGQDIELARYGVSFA